MTESEKDLIDDNADDLLEELQELEQSTASMEHSVEQAEQKHQALSNTDSPSTIDAATLSLEAAKTSQQAASQSQAAAEAAIKLSYEQKNQVMELTDSNLSWRQTLRAANNEIGDSKNTIVIMMVIAIAFSLIGSGIMGYLFYSMNKKHELMKGDVLDIIQTENTLFNRQLTLKLDQMSSLVEAMAADVRRLPVTPMVNGQAQMMPTTQPAAPLVDLGTEAQPMVPNAQMAEAPVQMAPPVNEPVQPMPPQPEMVPQTVVVDDQAIKAEVAKFAASQQQQLQKIEQLIANLMQHQPQIVASTGSPKTTTVTAPVEVKALGLTESQLKKLNNISWAVHKQGKMLKEIQQLLKAQQNAGKQVSKKDPLKGIEASLNDLNQQMKALKAQQAHIQKEVEDLKVETQKLAAKPSPYSYRAK